MILSHGNQRLAKLRANRECSQGGSHLRKVFVWRVAGVVLTVAVVVVGVLVALRQPFSVVSPVPELRSYDLLPTVISVPAFHAGPIPFGQVADQEMHVSESDVAVRLWVRSAYAGDDVSVRIELLAGPHGPSLRSGVVDLADHSDPIVARIVPPLRSSERPDGGPTFLRVTPVDGSGPIRVGMAKGKAYRSGRAFVNGEIVPEDQAFMFAVAQELSPGEVWRQIWTLIQSPTLPVRAGAVAGGIVLISSLAAAMAAPHRRIHTATAVGLVALLAVALVVIDRTAMSFFPGPDFGPSVTLR